MNNGEVDLLQGLTQTEAAEILALGSRLSVSSGEELFGLGAPARNLFLIRRGRISSRFPCRCGEARKM
jgi:hypothetical protein